MASRKKSSDNQKRKNTRRSSGSQVSKNVQTPQSSSGGRAGRGRSTSSNSSSSSRTKQGETPARQITPQQTPRTSRRNVSYTLRRTSRVFNMPSKTLTWTGGATPYRTPRLGTLGRQVSDMKTAEKKHAADADLWKEHLDALQNKTMKLCHLSSMSNFKYNNKNLRSKYENTLKNKVLEVYPSPQVVVRLTTTACLSLKPSVVDAVWLKVTSLVPGATQEQDRVVVVYSAWLFRTHHVQSTKLEMTEWFPIMLYAGRELIHQVVIDWLQGSFECYVARFGMRQSDLLWVAGVWSGRQCPSHIHKQKDSNINLTYQIHPPAGESSYTLPNHRGKPRIVLKISLSDIHHVWSSLVDSSQDEMSLGDQKSFFSCMNKLAVEMTSLPTSLLKLYQLHTPCITINADGKVRLTCQRSVTPLIKHLLDVCLQAANCSIKEQLQDPNGEVIAVSFTEDAHQPPT